MKGAGAILWWIDPTNFSLQSATIMPYELKSGSTYESEAQWKMPDGVEHYEIIMLDRHGEDSSKDRLERLKAKGDELAKAARGSQ